MDYFVSPEFIAGSIAGSIGIIVTQPLDTIRIRMQVHVNPPRSIGQHFTQIITQEGVRGLFRGLASPALTCGAMNAILFHSFEAARTTLVNSRLSNPNGIYSRISTPYTISTDSNYIDTIAAGFFAGCLSCIVTSPTELIKIIVQDETERGTATIHQEWKEAVGLYKNYGIGRGLFRGFHTTVMRDSWSYALYFWVYELVCNNYNKLNIFNFNKNKEINSDKTTMASFWGGFWAGLCCWSAAYPLDVIKTHYQLQRLEYKNLPFFQAVIYHLKYVGAIKPFFRGLSATLIRAGPQHGIVFVTYEFIRNEIIKMQGGNNIDNNDLGNEFEIDIANDNIDDTNDLTTQSHTMSPSI